MKNRIVIVAGFLLVSGFFSGITAQTTTHSRAIVFPDVEGYLTLACDFHQHTVFSDGNVWPTIRVQEAMKDGLDAISLTEHLEYQPHEEDIPHPDRNRSFNIAADAADGTNLIVVSGSEITRSMPPGHSNAIFVKDSNRLLMSDSVAVFEEANRQGAFVFWNHPNWTAQRADGVARLTDMHRDLIDRGLLHGIEVVNERTYSDEALQIALDNNLTIMGTSDVHGLVDWDFHVNEGGHRPVTLVFATERTEDGIHEALSAGRTVVFFNDLLIGREEFLQPLLKASLTVASAEYIGDSSVLRVSLTNVSDAPFVLESKNDYTFHADADLVIVPAHETKILDVKTLTRENTIRLGFEVLNAVTAPNTHPTLELTIPVNTP